jgi:hypothetical protein
MQQTNAPKYKNQMTFIQHDELKHQPAKRTRVAYTDGSQQGDGLNWLGLHGLCRPKFRLNASRCNQDYADATGVESSKLL